MKSGFIVFNCGGKKMGYIFWGREVTSCRKWICWLGLRWASTRAYNTRGNYFLLTREMTSTAAWSLSSETLGISRYFCCEINEHIVVLSLKGNSRDVGERDKVLLWIPFVSLLVMAFSILLHEHWLKSALIFIVFVRGVTVHFSSKYISVLQLPTATQPKSFELLGRVSWRASGCCFTSGFPVKYFETKALLPAFFQTMSLP